MYKYLNIVIFNKQILLLMNVSRWFICADVFVSVQQKTEKDEPLQFWDKFKDYVLPILHSSPRSCLCKRSADWSTAMGEIFPRLFHSNGYFYSRPLEVKNAQVQSFVHSWATGELTVSFRGLFNFYFQCAINGSCKKKYFILFGAIEIHSVLNKIHQCSLQILGYITSHLLAKRKM